MNKETYDTLMDLWDVMMGHIQAYKDDIVDLFAGYHFEENDKKQDIVDRAQYLSSKIIGVEEVIAEIRRMTKHAEIEE